MSLRLAPTFADALAQADRPLIGLWSVAASPLIAEILAGAGIDWLLIDMEHSSTSLDSVVHQLQAVAPYPVAPVVRVPNGDEVILKQVLDLGAQNVLVPMVHTADDARAMVAAVRYPPEGVRGVGSALARSARWNRVDGYLANANDHVSLFVQIESATAVAHAAEIAAVDGVAGVFVGPSDLAASMGLLGQQSHPDVVAAVNGTMAAVRAAGKFAGVNAFDTAVAERYIADGAAFVAVGADVSILARGSEALAARFISETSNENRPSY